MLVNTILIERTLAQERSAAFIRSHNPVTPKQMAWKLVRVLRPQRPDYPYLKKVFQHTRELLGVKPSKASKRFTPNS